MYSSTSNARARQQLFVVSMDKWCIVVKVKISFLNPNLGGLVGNMTNGCVKFIIDAKNVKIVILHKSLVFNFEKASFLYKKMMS
jgi:hypothetical protein